ncbi:unnamed protein product [Pseudo-nitzschia multistriata]|uniref:Uncharacterized protein n=1 Tax=Pseudo-nitzschia multistriata TaxID=183589 RepID=A0A448ZEM1_9STRA|nr:unnamed protein product [Pseudo-nitzschia multistriata]
MGFTSGKIGIVLAAFLFGCIVTTTIILNFVTLTNAPFQTAEGGPIISSLEVPKALPDASPTDATVATKNPLVGQRILIAIAAFDFSQIPHLEEVLDAYQDLCVTGASKVDVVVHATIAYPVTLIDMLNSRLLPACQGIFSITIVLKSKNLRLHLVDVHRELFYDKIDDYDLFIYTEDDIRVPPRVVGAYLSETKQVQDIVGLERSSNYNVGIVRYEYNFPGNVAVDDKTRHATQNVTRVYWEHGQYPVFDKAVYKAKDKDLGDSYVTMENIHQGMFMATSFLLKAWKVRENCSFHIASNRPSKKGERNQPAIGTQRVWMSSKHLYDRRYGCNVMQVLPTQRFGTLTVLHLPNKNYRRVGHFRNRTFSDGTETFDFGSESLLSEMKLHIEMRKHTTQVPTLPYAGIRMLDEVKGGRRVRTPLLERRMGEYQAYVDRGGILSEKDMTKTALVEER